MSDSSIDLRLDDAHHWAVLRLPLRVRIFDTLARADDAIGAKELAAAVGLETTALYAHLDALERARLVRIVGREDRRGAGRPGRRYEAAGRRLVVRFNGRDALERERAIELVDLMLRESAHDLRRAGTGAMADLDVEWAALTADELGALEEHVAAIRSILATSRARALADGPLTLSADRHVLLAVVEALPGTVPTGMPALIDESRRVD